MNSLRRRPQILKHMRANDRIDLSVVVSLTAFPDTNSQDDDDDGDDRYLPIGDRVRRMHDVHGGVWRARRQAQQRLTVCTTTTTKTTPENMNIRFH